MKITCDPVKRNTTLAGRGLDFEDAPLVFAGKKLEFPDERFEYGEERIVTVGFLHGRMVILIWTPRGAARHIISMRKANEKSKKGSGSNLAKVDAHVITAEEYKEIPELTEEWFQKASLYEGDKLIRRGRPPKEHPKVSLNLRLDPEIVKAFRATGSGWHTRMNNVLKAWAKRHPA